VARAVRRLQDLPGQHLFQYVGDDGGLCPIGSSDVNAYLRAASGSDITAKEYRTWMGTVLAASGLAALPPPEGTTQARDGLKAVIAEVSRELGNTPTVCRASYVHPRVIEAYEDGSLPERWSAVPARASRYVTADERRLLALLKSRRRRRREATTERGAATTSRAANRAAARGAAA
jgi:DNA topoisomerase-1